ncbi:MULTISPECIES: SRPBCC family protein [unclassified Streptosporangium]|uniref:SRPBCC family protein n=1 Tax=unclassified Streptosporangium TaxID=2632669 RepID=UPI002E2BCF2F|nr:MULTISPECIES: SRPBCC family protein [unclassified Streptosporangium]
MIIGIDTGAPVVVRLDITVDAPIDRVWALHTDIAAWPTWQHEITAANIDEPLTAGATFHWSTFGLDIASTVRLIDPPHRILWGGPAHGITGIHQWTFETVGSGGTRVLTEESWDGDPIRADVPAMQAALHQSLTTWLTLLKNTSENKSV